MWLRKQSISRGRSQQQRYWVNKTPGCWMQNWSMIKRKNTITCRSLFYSFWYSKMTNNKWSGKVKNKAKFLKLNKVMHNTSESNFILLTITLVLRRKCKYNKVKSLYWTLSSMKENFSLETLLYSTLYQTIYCLSSCYTRNCEMGF